jgi:hypothetical protein
MNLLLICNEVGVLIHSKHDKGGEFMANENLKKWLAGGYVAAPDFLNELRNVVEQNEEQQKEIERMGKMPFIEVNNELRAKVAHYERILRRIDSDIRCTEDPIPFIVSTLVEVLPEYK